MPLNAHAAVKAIITIITVAHITNEAYCLVKHSHSFAKFHFFRSYYCKKKSFEEIYNDDEYEME